MNPPPPPLPTAASNAQTSALAVWSLVLGVLGLFLCFPALGGLVCGIVALIRISRGNGSLRGNGLAIAGIVVSLVAPFVVSIAAGIVFPLVTAARMKREQLSGKTLAEARSGFATHLTRQDRTKLPVPEPPAGALNRVTYHSPIGDLAAYVSPIPDDGKLHPAIVWLFGGFSNSIGEGAWEDASIENDQSARAFREAGVVTLYPSLRGGNQNPGFHESFFGEADDVLAAAEFLAAQHGIDPRRIHLGGHSTGGTLALLVAEMSPRFRAVFAFGPVARASDYGAKMLTFDTANVHENRLRNPIVWLHAVRSPTFIFEGDTQPSNLDSLHELKAATSNTALHFCVVAGKSHFSILAPFTRRIADQIMKDTEPDPHFNFEEIERRGTR